jgi:hypothetical protein
LPETILNPPIELPSHVSRAATFAPLAIAIAWLLAIQAYSGYFESGNLSLVLRMPNGNLPQFREAQLPQFLSLGQPRVR